MTSFHEIEEIRKVLNSTRLNPRKFQKSAPVTELSDLDIDLKRQITELQIALNASQYENAKLRESRDTLTSQLKLVDESHVKDIAETKKSVLELQRRNDEVVQTVRDSCEAVMTNSQLLSQKLKRDLPESKYISSSRLLQSIVGSTRGLMNQLNISPPSVMS